MVDFTTLGYFEKKQKLDRLIKMELFSNNFYDSIIIEGGWGCKGFFKDNC